VIYWFFITVIYSTGICRWLFLTENVRQCQDYSLCFRDKSVTSTSIFENAGAIPVQYRYPYINDWRGTGTGNAAELKQQGAAFYWIRFSYTPLPPFRRMIDFRLNFCQFTNKILVSGLRKSLLPPARPQPPSGVASEQRRHAGRSFPVPQLPQGENFLT
jgi:hypothetical protein